MNTRDISLPSHSGWFLCRRAAAFAASAGVALAAGVAFLLGATAAQAGPCTSEIAAVEQQVRQLQAAPPASGEGEPSAAQTLGAQLHRQPTPGTVQRGQQSARADADAALDQARKADAAGNAADCTEALRAARNLYGID